MPPAHGAVSLVRRAYRLEFEGARDHEQGAVGGGHDGNSGVARAFVTSPPRPAPPRTALARGRLPLPPLQDQAGGNTCKSADGGPYSSSRCRVARSSAASTASITSAVGACSGDDCARLRMCAAGASSSELVAVGSAPASSSASTVSVNPLAAAECSGVLPNCAMGDGEGESAETCKQLSGHWQQRESGRERRAGVLVPPSAQ